MPQGDLGEPMIRSFNTESTQTSHHKQVLGRLESTGRGDWSKILSGEPERERMHGLQSKRRNSWTRDKFEASRATTSTMSPNSPNGLATRGIYAFCQQSPEEENISVVCRDTEGTTGIRLQDD